MKDILKQIVIQILGWQSRLVLKKSGAKVAAVTGSVGKTSTKDAIATVLSAQWRVRKSTKSYNSEIGIPLAILNLKSAWSNPLGWLWNIISGFLSVIGLYKRFEWLVVEVGADAPGDIKKVSEWLETNVVTITRLPDIPVHVEFFESPEMVIKEKMYLIDTLRRGGALILNYDDREVMKAQSKTDNETYSYGFDPGSSVWASNYSLLYEEGRPTGIIFRVDYSGSSVPVKIYGVAGRQHAYAALAGLAAGVSQGINLVTAAKKLEDHKTPPGRMRIIAGVKNSTIIDDSYNSSPAAAQASLETLEELNTSGKKIAILGDMAELGEYSERAHKSVGAKTLDILDVLVTVGAKARGIAAGALEYGMDESNVFQFDDSRKAGKHVESMISPGDVVLVKGSQSVRTEKAVEEMMAYPEEKQKLLVRQEKEWQYRT